MDDDNTNGVFGLITKLCEKFYKDPDEIKATRSRCYEIILKKRLPKYKKRFKDLKGASDPTLNLLSWVFQLVHGYGLQEHAEKILKAAENLKDCYKGDQDTYRSILYLLLNFRNAPKRNENKWDLCMLPSFDFKHEEDKLNTLFVLPASLQQECENYFSDTFYLESNTFELGQFQFPKQSEHEILHTKDEDEHPYQERVESEDDGISEESMWEMAAREPFCKRRTWESYGYAEPDKEQPFLSELGDLSSLWVENLETLYMVPIFREEEPIYQSKKIPRKTFIMNLKYLLAGMASDCFSFDGNGNFCLDPNVSVEGITPDTLRAYCRPLLVCGNCHKALEKMCTPNPDTGKYKYEGYIFSSKLCHYLMGAKPSIISCCLTRDQLDAVYHSTVTYFLEVSEEIGPQFSISNALTKYKTSDPNFLSLIAKKRAATMKRIELERLKAIEEQKMKKMDEMNALREQYDMALEQVQLNVVKEIQEDMRQVQENIEIEEKRQKLVKEEADKMIEYYTKLYEQAEKKKALIEKHVKVFKSIHFNRNTETENAEEKHCTEDTEHQAVANSSNESFYSLHDDKQNETEKVEEQETKQDDDEEEAVFHDSTTNFQIHSSESMDILNANTEDQLNEVPAEKTVPPHIQTVIDNYKMAKQIKQKVMTQEMGIDFSSSADPKRTEDATATYLTEAQKNKLRILSSEFGIEVKDVRKLRMSKAAQNNKNRILGTSDCFHYLDNVDFVNKNHEESMKKSKSLTLDLSKKQPKQELDRPVPMSVDSTPQSELSCSTIYMSVDVNQTSTTPTTARTESEIQLPFDHNQNPSAEAINLSQNVGFLPKMVFSKRVPTKVARCISTNCLSLVLEESIHIPLVAQTKAVNNELLRYFIHDLKYLDHLHSLRDYFFQLDCEFGRNVTDTLFTKLYESSVPSDVISCRMLKELLYRACDVSGKNQDNSQRLSFRMTGMPKRLDLGDPNVLDFISLTYKIQWPLNILLPADTISKYDEIFKFLLKLHRASWVLKKIFLELKSLAKEMGEKEIYLMSSPQYRRLHHHRHIMTHFIQTFQDYIVGEVLQASWESFERELPNATNLDELYSMHVSYVKKIIILCMLHQKMNALKTVIHKIFVVVLKFYDYLRSRLWVCKDGAYIHPNFEKLDSIFKNFEELVAFFFKVARKVGKCGLQPHLIQLLDMLDVNNYYTNISLAFNKHK
ncbi:unnamed protein product [Acanthoscelides obtectus]|uniref:Gamma tubulin complex component C-terminal domain-containing protein n=1 Tax=Acanthoscelides obtectus TaxID=200917 RepID=A0A9P0PTS1_ACAOB|nr:unnamed protein product [Acanthoscelides obtectus]CAK1676974.1 Gamma-tubulin complex component 6 [Acanthoscelides obtectus]